MQYGIIHFVEKMILNWFRYEFIQFPFFSTQNTPKIDEFPFFSYSSSFSFRFDIIRHEFLCWIQICTYLIHVLKIFCQNFTERRGTRNAPSTTVGALCARKCCYCRLAIDSWSFFAHFCSFLFIFLSFLGAFPLKNSSFVEISIIFMGKHAFCCISTQNSIFS